jgi:hypothetical protein
VDTRVTGKLKPQQQYAELRKLIVKEHGETIAKLIDRYIKTGFEDKARLPFNIESMILTDRNAKAVKDRRQ